MTVYIVFHKKLECLIKYFRTRCFFKLLIFNVVKNGCKLKSDEAYKKKKLLKKTLTLSTLSFPMGLHYFPFRSTPFFIGKMTAAWEKQILDLTLCPITYYMKCTLLFKMLTTSSAALQEKYY